MEEAAPKRRLLPATHGPRLLYPYYKWNRHRSRNRIKAARCAWHLSLLVSPEPVRVAPLPLGLLQDATQGNCSSSSSRVCPRRPRSRRKDKHETRVFTTHASPTTRGDFSQCCGRLKAVLGTGLQWSSKVSQPRAKDVSASTLRTLTR